MKKIKIIYIILALFILTSCQNNKDKNGKDENKTVENDNNSNKGEVFMSSDYYPINILERETKKKKGENLLVSPYSINEALLLLARGAEGESLKEIEKLLGGDVDTISNRAKNIGEKIQKNIDENKDYYEIDPSFKSLNSIWIKNNFSVKEDYLKESSGEVFEEPFDKSTLEKINSWVSEGTNGKIDKMLDDLDEQLRMLLINTLYFNDEWQKKYTKDDIQKLIFKAKEAKECDFLVSSEKYYLENDDFKGFKKEYLSGANFIGLMAKEGKIEDKLGLLSREKISDFISKSREDADLTVKIPKFDFEYKGDLKEIFENMGIENIFSNEADFSKISDEKLKVSDIIHKTFISFNETGTEAGAATLIGMEMMSAPAQREMIELVFDRPFLFFIEYDGEILFMGIVNDIK